MLVQCISPRILPRVCELIALCFTLAGISKETSRLSRRRGYLCFGRKAVVCSRLITGPRLVATFILPARASVANPSSLPHRSYLQVSGSMAQYGSDKIELHEYPPDLTDQITDLIMKVTGSNTVLGPQIFRVASRAEGKEDILKEKTPPLTSLAGAIFERKCETVIHIVFQKKIMMEEIVLSTKLLPYLPNPPPYLSFVCIRGYLLTKERVFDPPALRIEYIPRKNSFHHRRI